MLQKLLKTIKEWPEIFSVPIALILWEIAPRLIRWIEPTAATFDDGILHALTFAVLSVMIFSGLAFAGIRFNFPDLYNWYSNNPEHFFTISKDFQKCDSKTKMGFFLALYLGLLLSFSLVLSAIL